MHIIYRQFCQILIDAVAAYAGEGYYRDSANMWKHFFHLFFYIYFLPLHIYLRFIMRSLENSWCSYAAGIF